MTPEEEREKAGQTITATIRVVYSDDGKKTNAKLEMNGVYDWVDAYFLASHLLTHAICLQWESLCARRRPHRMLGLKLAWKAIVRGIRIARRNQR